MRPSILALALLLGVPAAAAAQSGEPSQAAHPNSDMGPAAGNSGDAGNGVGHAGSLTEDHGSHSSTVTGMGGAASLGDKGSHPSPANGSNAGGTKLETDPTQGGGQQHQ